MTNERIVAHSVTHGNMMVDTGATIKVGNNKVKVYDLDRLYLRDKLGRSRDPLIRRAMRQAAKPIASKPAVAIPMANGWLVFLARRVPLMGIFVPSQTGVDPFVDEGAIYNSRVVDPDIIEPFIPALNRDIQKMNRMDYAIAELEMNLTDVEVETLAAQKERGLATLAVQSSEAALQRALQGKNAIEVRLEASNARFINRKASVHALRNASKAISAQTRALTDALTAHTNPLIAGPAAIANLESLGIITSPIIAIDHLMRSEAAYREELFAKSDRLDDLYHRDYGGYSKDEIKKRKRAFEKALEEYEEHLKRSRRKIRERLKKQRLKKGKARRRSKKLEELYEEALARKRAARKNVRDLNTELERIRKETERLKREAQRLRKTITRKSTKRQKEIEEELERLKRQKRRADREKRELLPEVADPLPEPKPNTSPRPRKRDPVVLREPTPEPVVAVEWEITFGRNGPKLAVKPAPPVKKRRARRGDSKISGEDAKMLWAVMPLLGKAVDMYNVFDIFLENVTIVTARNREIRAYNFYRTAWDEGRKSEVNIGYIARHMFTLHRELGSSVEFNLNKFTRQVIQYYAINAAAGRIQGYAGRKIQRDFERAGGHVGGIRVQFKLDTIGGRLAF